MYTPKDRSWLDPITSLADLQARANGNTEYEAVAYHAVWNLGDGQLSTLEEAIAWLRRHAEETDGGEAAVVAAFNGPLTSP